MVVLFSAHRPISSIRDVFLDGVVLPHRSALRVTLHYIEFEPTEGVVTLFLHFKVESFALSRWYCSRLKVNSLQGGLSTS